MIQTSESSIIYAGNNSVTVPYPVPFYFKDDEDLVVVSRDELGLETGLTLGTDYTPTGEGDPSGGSIKTTVPVALTSTLSISRIVPMTQLVSYEEGDSFPAKSHEGALDKLTMEVQQLARGLGTGSGGATDLGSAFRVTPASGGLVPVSKKDDSTLGIDALGNPVLRTPSDMLGWLGQVGTVWPNTAARLNTRGAYAGQLGVQVDNSTIYIAHSTVPGDWLPFLIGTGIISATDGVPYLLPPPAGDLVGTSGSQVLYNKTLISPAIQVPTGLTKADVGLSQVDNTSDLNKPISVATASVLATKQDKNEKGFSNGYASLDGGGKVPIAQIPDALIGASQYKGTWNASTNSPSITTGSAPGKTGWYYTVSVAGTTAVDGISSWAVGDQIISNGTVWQKIVNVSAVSSVNTKTGVVVINQADVGLSNVDNTSVATQNAAAATLTNKTINGASNTLIVRLDADVANSLPVNRLNGGTGAGAGTFWCGDNSWKTPVGSGDVVGPNGSGSGELAIYSGTTGKIIGRFSGTAGFAKASATGLLTTQARIGSADVDGTFISGQTDKVAPDWGDTLLVRDSVSGNLCEMLVANAAHAAPRGWLSGCTLSNNTTDAANDLDVAAGLCRDDTNTADISFPATITKRLDALWATGTNQGGRDTGAIADAWWHVFAIRNPATNACDVLFSQSISAPTMPSGFTQKRRIGSGQRISGTGFRPFRQYGDYFQFTTAPTDVVNRAMATGQSTNDTLSVPAGLKIRAHVQVRAYCGAANGQLAMCDADQPSTTANIFMPVTNIMSGFICTLWTGSTALIYWNCPSSAGSTVTISLNTLGYWDHRGKED